ncbi:hypothetical protein J2X36_001341 [Methylobacterium sp. BE186]|uniref:hypothetical protein n=1 Tax=Methylobacterium sp. BE186 TaxID=2817715 RepID=UPI002861DF5D|nr:hypothetical protein [Methylobacterium sp. BE186]MDR7036600.1 hypothetical protein [Methylobacterium sp. BE186]
MPIDAAAATFGSTVILEYVEDHWAAARAAEPDALWTDSEPAVLQVSGTGPFGLTYINPADDPSRPAAGR